MRVNGEEPEIDDSDLQVDLNLSRNHVYNIESAGHHYLSKDSILGKVGRHMSSLSIFCPSVSDLEN